MSELRRTLSRWDVVWFFVTAVVGLRWIASAAAAGPSSLAMWLAALVCFYVPLAFTVTTLSARFPEEGGLYVWTKRAFGDFAAFIAGFMYWMSVITYFPGLLYFAAGNALFVLDPSGRTLAESPAYFISASLVILAVALATNLAGLRFGRWLQNLGGYATWLPIAVLLALGVLCVARFGVATPIRAAELVPQISATSITFWSTLAFGFVGFEAAAFMGEEIVGGARTIRRAIFIAGAIIAAIYILGTVAVLVALPRGEVSGLQGIMQALAGTASRAGWPGLVPALAALLTLGTLGGVCSWLASTSRLPFVAGVDRALPPAFGRLHPRWGTPWVSLIVAAVTAAVVACLGQAGATVKDAYDVLVSFAVIATFIPFVFLFAALLRLDARPHARALAVVGLLVTLLSIVLACLPPAGAEHPLRSVAKVVGGSVVLLVVGALLFRRGVRRAPPPSP